MAYSQRVFLHTGMKEEQMVEASGGLKIFSGLAVRAAFDDGLLELFTGEHGPVTVEWNPTTVIEAKIARGEAADLIIATTSAIEKLVQKGLVHDSSRKRLIDAYLGVAVAHGAPQPKIGTTEEFLAAMKQARSVAWSIGGQSGIYLEKILASHGLLDEVKGRASTIPEGFTAERIVAGEADLAVQQVSELMVVKGVDIVGPFPDALQSRTPFEIAMFENAAHPELARKFIDFLGGSRAQQAFLRNGVELAAA
jgi:molybdate transport system substrate-binding protein